MNDSKSYNTLQDLLEEKIKTCTKFS